MEIRRINKEDYTSIAQIYKEGLATGIASFETEIPTWEKWNNKFLPDCRFVVLVDEEIAAWCALSAVSKRYVYRGVAENTIYVASKFQHKGIGKILLLHLIDESEKHGFWTLQAGIFPQNKPSIHLHESCGFRIIGIRERIGVRDGIWYDNVILERRA